MFTRGIAHPANSFQVQFLFYFVIIYVTTPYLTFNIQDMLDRCLVGYNILQLKNRDTLLQCSVNIIMLPLLLMRASC